MRLPRPRLSLRSLLVVILVLGFGLGWIVHKRGIQRRAVAQVKRLGGTVSYDYENAPWTPGIGSEPRGPRWLRRLIGDELFQEVVEVDLCGLDLRDADLSCLEAFPKLARLHLTCARFGDDDLARLGSLELGEILVLGLADTGISDAGLSSIGAFRRLTVLDLGHNPITDDGLQHLAPLENLRVLSLVHTTLDGRGLVQLGVLRRLKSVDLAGSGASDDARARLVNSVPGVYVAPSSAGSMTLSSLRAASRR